MTTFTSSRTGRMIALALADSALGRRYVQAAMARGVNQSDARLEFAEMADEYGTQENRLRM